MAPAHKGDKWDGCVFKMKGEMMCVPHDCIQHPSAEVTIFAGSWGPIQENVLAEAAMMIPDTRQRLEAALQDLHSMLVWSQSLSDHVHNQNSERFSSVSVSVK